MKRGVVPRCAARPLEPPAQVHPDHHAEDGAVAVAEHADGAEPVDEEAVLPKRYKNRDFSSIVPKKCDGPSTQTPTQDDTTTIRQTTTACESSGGCRGQSAPRDSQSWVWHHQSHRGSSNQTGHRHWRKTSTRSGLRQTEKIRGGIVQLLDYVKKEYKRLEARPPLDRSTCTVVHDDENDAENNEGVFSHFSFPRLWLPPSS